MLTAPPRTMTVRPNSQPRLGYRPALDGVRALAVVAVFAYHAHLPWARAGFLGVDLFFVLSGYLITALLLAERRREGRIDLRRFWARRARRLLPAVLVLLATTAVAVPILAADQAHRIRGDLLSALGYVFNWRLIFGEQSYFQSAGRPPILQHLWSLAVEEQFYLVWPPVLAFLLRHRPHRRIVRPLLVAAGASAALMALLFTPYSDPSRVYYGTDTRAAALLAGAALAAATTRWQVVESIRRSGGRLLDVLGLAALGGLAWAVANVNEFDPMLYRGGFLAVALAAAAVVAAAARPGRPGLLGRALGMRPLVWLGRRSYSVYLWFWPVLMLTRPHLDVPLTGLPLLALRIGLTLALACASYRFIELPARSGAIGRLWRDIRFAWSFRSAPARRTAAWGMALSLVLAAVGVGLVVSHGEVSPARATTTAAAAGLNSAAAAKVADSLPPAPPPPPPATTTTAAPATTVAPPVAATPPPAPTTTLPVFAPPASLPTVAARVTAIGDSVLLGAKPLLELQVPGILVDAAVARQFAEVLSIARAFRDGGKLGDVVVLQTGNNGPFSAGQFDQLLDAAGSGGRKVLVVNVHVQRAWQDPNNDIIAAAVQRRPNVHLVDWRLVASSHPEAFFDDGLHLTSTGIRLFTAAVLQTI